MSGNLPPPPPDETPPEPVPPVPGYASPAPPQPVLPTNEPKPGAGQPLVEGPPASVGPPVRANLFNMAGGIGCVALGVGALIVLVIVLVVLFRVL
jgi:hypothetical protein